MNTVLCEKNDRSAALFGGNNMIARHCGLRTNKIALHMREPYTHEMPEEHLYALLCFAANQSRYRIIIVNPALSFTYATTDIQQDINEQIYGNRDNYDIILLPIYWGAHWMFALHHRL